MVFQELIKIRESCRNYAEKPVAHELLEQIVEAGRLAPSACNSQPWTFIVAESADAAAKACECVQPGGANRFASKAPAFIVVVEEIARLMPGLGESLGDNQFFAAFDTGLAVANMCLAASDLGLGTCIMGLLDQDKLREYFPISESGVVRVVLSVGYPADEKPRKKGRKAVEDVAKYL